MGYNDWKKRVTGQAAESTASSSTGGYAAWKARVKQAATEKQSIKNYDANNDSIVDIRDVVRAKKITNNSNKYAQEINKQATDAIKKTIGSPNFFSGDFNGDLVVNEKDEKIYKENEKLRNADVNALQTELDNLEAILENAKAKKSNTSKARANTLTKKGAASIEAFNQKDGSQQDYDNYLKSVGYSSIEEIEKTLTEKKAFLNNAKRVQNRIKLSSVDDSSSENYDPEFDKYREEGYKVSYEDIGSEILSFGGGMATSGVAVDNYRAAALALYEHLGNEIPKKYTQKDTDDKISIFREMSFDEFRRFAYYLGKDKENGTDSAKEYIDAITDELNYRRGTELADDIKDKDILRYLYVVPAGLDQFTSGVKGALNFKGEYMPTSAIQYASSQIGEEIYKEDGETGKAIYDLGTTTANMLPSILVGAAANLVAPGAGAVVGAGLMGASAGGSAYQEMINLGYDTKQAQAYGALVGASEAALGYAFSGISALGGKVTGNVLKGILDGIDNGLAKFAIKYGGSVLSEGFEEAAQEVLTPLFENIALQYDKNSFKDINWDEVVYSGLLGAISAGLLEFVPTVSNTEYEAGIAKAEKLSFNGDTKAMQIFADEALAGNPTDSEAYKLALKYKQRLDNNKKLSGTQLHKLRDIYESAIKENDKVKIKNAVAARLEELWETANIPELSDIITRGAAGENVTSAEKRIIKDSTYGTRVTNELNPVESIRKEYSSYWTELIETERIYSDVYNKSDEIQNDSKNINELEQKILAKDDNTLTAAERAIKQSIYEKRSRREGISSDADMLQEQGKFAKPVESVNKEENTESGNSNQRVVIDFSSDDELSKQLGDLHGETAETTKADTDAEVTVSENNNSKITIGMSNSERYDILKNREITLVETNEDAYNNVAKNKSELLNESLKKTTAKGILKKIGSEFSIFKNYTNEDIELEFEFGKNNLDESVNKQKGNYDIFAKMLSCFSDVINNAVGIEVHNRNNQGYKTDRTLKQMYVLCSAFIDGETIIPVKLEVKEFTDKPNRLYVAVALEGIKRDRVVSMGVPNNRSHVRTSPVTISIRDLFSKINPKDRDFIKYIPDGFLTEEQIKVKRDTAHRVNDVGRPVGNALKNGISSNTVPQNAQTVNNISKGAENNSTNSKNDLDSMLDESDNAPQEATEERESFTEPSSKEIYRKATDEEGWNSFLGIYQNNVKQRHISDVAKKLDPDMKLLWVSANDERLSGKNGKYIRSTNTMYLSKDATVAEMYFEVFKHEFMHRLESKGSYIAFKKYLFDKSIAFEQYVRAQLKIINKGKSFEGSREDAINTLTKYYFDKFQNDKIIGKPLKDKFTLEDAQREIVADFAGEVLFKGSANNQSIAKALSNEDMLTIGEIESTVDALEELAKTDRNLFQRIMDVIRDFIRTLRGQPQTKSLVKDLEYIEQRLARIYDSADTKKAAKNSGDEQFSIAKDGNGSYVKVDTSQELFEGKTIKEMQEIARKLIRDNFKGKVFNVGERGKAYVNKRSSEEYAYPANRRMDDNLKEAKMKTAPELDNLLSVSKYIEHQNDDGRHPEATGGWDVYSTCFEVGGKFFEGEVKIMITDHGYIFYDITQIRRTTRNGGLTENNSAAASGNPSNDSIHDNKSTVNSKSMQTNKNNSSDESFSLGSPMQQARESFTMQEARERLARYESGEITREEYLSGLKKEKTFNPVEIANLREEDANTTPHHERKKVMSDGDKESKFYSSLLESDIFDERFKNEVRDDSFIQKYKSVTNRETLRAAAKELDEGGQSYVNQWFNLKPERASLIDTAVGFILMDRYQRIGDYESATAVAQQVRTFGTAGGQQVQIFSILGRLDPNTMAVYAQKELTKAFETMAKGRTKKWIDKNAERFNLTEADIEFIRRKTLEAAQLPEGRDKAIRLAEIATLLQDKLPPQKGQRLRALQRMSMLLNVKTNIRNITGNGIMVPVFIVSDFFGSGIDKATSKLFNTGIRTTGNFDIKSVKGMKKGFYETMDDYRKHINTRNEELNRFDVGSGKSFNENHSGKLAKQLNDCAKVLNALDRFTSLCLELGDRPFYEMWYINSLNNQLKLNNAAEATPEMIAIASLEALQRTWQDPNKLVRVVAGSKQYLNMINIGGFGLGDIMIKFTKTPANLTKAIFDFSPAGLLKAIAADGRTLKNAVETGQFEASMQKKFVDSLSKGITGTLLYVLAAGLAGAGLISGGSDEDKDVSNFEKYIQGIPEYSVKLGDKWHSYEWMQPLGAIAATVTDYMKTTKENPDNKWYEDILEAIKAGGEVLYNQSFMKSIQNLFTADNIIDGVIDSILDEPSVYVPQLLSQAANATDEYRRVTYESGKPLQTAINKVKVKIPVLRQTLEKQVDVLGRDVPNSQGDFLNAFINPANTFTDTSNSVTDELYNVYRQTGNKTVMPRVAPYKLTVKGKTRSFSAEERGDFQRISGNTTSLILEQAFKSKDYEKLSDEEKVKFIGKVYDFATAYTKSSFDYDYEALSAMVGENKNGEPILKESSYKKLSDEAKEMLAQEYFLSSTEIQYIDNYNRLIKYYINQVRQ